MKKGRKNGLEAQTMTMAKQKKKQNEANKANKAQSGEQNNNQPDRNGGDLPCGGRQPLNAAADPPNPPSSIFEVAEVVENQKVSFGESVDTRIKKLLHVEHGTSLTYQCQNENPAFCQKRRIPRRLLVGCYVWSQSRQYLPPVENIS